MQRDGYSRRVRLEATAKHMAWILVLFGRTQRDVEKAQLVELEPECRCVERQEAALGTTPDRHVLALKRHDLAKVGFSALVLMKQMLEPEVLLKLRPVALTGIEHYDEYPWLGGVIRGADPPRLRQIDRGEV